MKLFKRIAAGLLACAMALSMAACGGGGGGGGTGASTAKAKLAKTPLATGGSVTLESVNNDNSSDKITFGSNGTSIYVREVEPSSDVVYLKNSSGIYGIDMTKTNKTVQNISSDANMKVLMGLFETMLNAKDDLTNAQNGQIEISGKTYDSAIITTKVEGVSYDIAYCFDGDTLKYVSFFSGTSTNAFLTLAVNSVNGSVDSNLLTTNGWTSGGTAKPTEPSSSSSSSSTTTDKIVVAIDKAHFPDAYFRSYVSTKCDKNGDSYLSESEIASVTFFDISDANGENWPIADYTGIEYFTELKQLYIEDNTTLATLDVSKNTKLFRLSCTTGMITSLKVPSSIEYLTCKHPGSTVSGVEYPGITSINLSACLKLKELNVSGNRLTSLDVTNCPNLEKLYFSNNKISKIDLSNCPKLTELSCDSNKLDVLNVKSNPSLESLNCGYNSLGVLNLTNNPSLKKLYCYDNELTVLDISNCSSLEDMMCDNNMLSHLGIGTNKDKLWRISCSNNKLSSLDVSSLPSLKKLYCGKQSDGMGNLTANADPLLDTIDVSGNGNLTINIYGSSSVKFIYGFSKSNMTLNGADHKIGTGSGGQITDDEGNIV